MTIDDDDDEPMIDMRAVMTRANELRNARYAEIINGKGIGDIRADRSIRKSHSHSRAHRAIR